MKKILLWLIILPLSIILSFFISMLYEKLVWYTFPPESHLKYYLSAYGAYSLKGFLFVLPAIIAPNYKKQTALALVIIFTIIVIAAQIVVDRYTYGYMEAVYLPVIIGILCSIFVYYKIGEKFK